MILLAAPARRLARNVAALVALLVGVPAVAVHLPGARELFARTPLAACPLGHTGATETSALLADTAQAEAEASQANLLGLGLYRATLEDTLAWAARRALTCSPAHKAHVLRCEGHDPAQLSLAFAAAQAVVATFHYNGHKKLVGGNVQLSFADAQQAAAAGHAQWQATSDQLGAHASLSGQFTADDLRQGLLRQARAEFRRNNVTAAVSSTNFGRHYQVTHQVTTDPAGGR